MRPDWLFTAASASYLANCGLGTAVATRALRTEKTRWVHHGLYILTCSLTGAAASSLLWSRCRAGWLLLPTVVPLVLIHRLSARSRGHVVVALSAAPFFAAGLLAVHTDEPAVLGARTATTLSRRRSR